MNFRRFALIGVALPNALCSFCNTKEDAHPNIVIINIDDLGWADLSCNGSKYYETPNIDSLRHKGVWFSRAYAGAANSAPSRACMLTGQNTPRHGIYTVGNPDRGNARLRRLISVPNKTSLDSGTQILPKALQDCGYQTFHVGKWHVTKNPLECGMDVNIGGNHAGNPSTYFAPYRNANLADGVDGEFLTERLGNEAVALIRNRDKEKPFFLYYATYAVHTPLQAPDSIVEKYRNKQSNSAHDNPVYAALVESMDRNVGKVLNAITEEGLSENTLIIFTSDNGGVYDISRQWPLRAGKGSFYEGGIRVPLVIYQKSRFEQGEVDDVAVSQLDIFPTLLELIGAQSDNFLLDGTSLVSLLNDKDKSSFCDRPLFWHFPAYLEGGNIETVDMDFRTRPVSVVLKDNWKLIENYEDKSLELYDLQTDLSERNNLADKEVSKAKELLSLLNSWKAATNAPTNFLPNPSFKP